MCINTLLVGELPKLEQIEFPCANEHQMDYLSKCFSPKQMQRVLSEKKSLLPHFSPKLCTKDACEVGSLGQDVMGHLSPQTKK